MRTLIAAEVASNHGGDLELAKEFVRMAAAAGVDFVKFQSWQAFRLRDGSNDPQYDWFQRSEISDAAHVALIDECNRNGVRFLTTAFDENRLDFLASLGLEVIKIASPDANNVALLKKAKTRFAHVIVSTGFSTEPEIRETVELLKGIDFTICHCVSLYPTPPESAHMDRVDWLRTLSAKIGYSDHSIGKDLAKIAIAKRVNYLEKHLGAALLKRRFGASRRLFEEVACHP